MTKEEKEAMRKILSEKYGEYSIYFDPVSNYSTVYLEGNFTKSELLQIAELIEDDE